MEKEFFELFNTQNANFSAKICECDGGKVIVFLIESYVYKGQGPYYLIKDDIEKYIAELTHMSKTLCGECCINDTESTNSITVFFKGRELFVKGSVGDYGQHLLTFEFLVDQTILLPLSNVLHQLIR